MKRTTKEEVCKVPAGRAGQEAVMNRIIEVKLSLDTTTNQWFVHVIKEFAPEYGGGTQTFSESGGNQIHRALDVARGMVTLSPAPCPGPNGGRL